MTRRSSQNPPPRTPTPRGSPPWVHRDLPRCAPPASWGRSAARGSLLWTTWTTRSYRNHLSPFLCLSRGVHPTRRNREFRRFSPLNRGLPPPKNKANQAVASQFPLQRKTGIRADLTGITCARTGNYRDRPRKSSCRNHIKIDPSAGSDRTLKLGLLSGGLAA